jgi:glycine dehydrogenase subunit 1
MLAALGIDSVERLFDDIPAAVRADGLDLTEPRSELSLSRELEALAARNRIGLASFLGAGVYQHHVPAAVDAVISRSEFYTAYTPYQPEISQGTLQSVYEFQSLIAELTGLPVVSASHYDGAAATAEAALMTLRATRRERVLISRAVHRHYVETTATYFLAGSRVLEELPTAPDGTTDLAALERALADEERPVAGVIMGQPNAFGLLEPMREAADLAHAAGPASWPSSNRSRWPCWRRPASTAPTSPPARVSRWASRPSTAVPTWACWRRAASSCARCPGGSWAARPTSRDAAPSS